MAIATPPPHFEASVPSDEILTVREVAARLKVHEKDVYKLVYDEGLPYRRAGRRRLRFLWSEVMGWLEARKGA